MSKDDGEMSEYRSQTAKKEKAKERLDFFSAPKDYAELFTMYYDYVVGLVHKMGIDVQRKEDVASEILLRFYERDFLHRFDPSLVFSYNGEPRPARFKSFLNAFVMAYVRNHRDRQNRLRRRELLICNMPVVEGGATWIEVFGDIESDDYSYLDEEELVNTLREYLRLVPRRSSVDRCDLLKLFDAVLAQVRLEGKCSVEYLQEQFGISSTAVHSWLGWLRVNVAEALGMPLPEKRIRKGSKGARSSCGA